MTMTRTEFATMMAAYEREGRLEEVARLAALADVPAPTDPDGPVARFLLGVSGVLTAELVERRGAYPAETLEEGGRGAVETEDFTSGVVGLIVDDPSSVDAVRLDEFVESLSPNEAGSLPSFTLIQVVGKRLGDALVAGSGPAEAAGAAPSHVER